METSTKIWAGIIIVGVVILLLIANYSGNVVKKDKITIGCIVPLSGDLAVLGQNVKPAMELAVEKINAEGGINGKELEIIFEDEKCNSKEAVNAANKLINVDGVPVIIGPTCSASTMAIAPIAENAKVVVFSTGSSAPTITNAGDYIFRDYPTDTFQGKFAAEYAYNELGARKVAVMYTLGDYGVGINNNFIKNFEKLGGKVVYDEGFDQSTKDLRTQLTKIKSAKPDLIYFVSYTEAGIIGLKQIKELGIKAKILGGDAWDDPKILEEAGKAAEGIMYTIPAMSGINEEFKQEMKEKTGSEEITVSTPNSYDAVMIIAEIMRKVGTNTEKIKDALYQVKDYEGVSGKITIDENGDLADAEYEIKIVRNGRAEII